MNEWLSFGLLEHQPAWYAAALADCAGPRRDMQQVLDLAVAAVNTNARHGGSVEHHFGAAWEVISV